MVHMKNGCDECLHGNVCRLKNLYSKVYDLCEDAVYDEKDTIKDIEYTNFSITVDCEHFERKTAGF